MGELAEIIHARGNRQSHFVECTIIGGVVCPAIRMHGYDLYLYGCGVYADTFVSFFEDQQIKVSGVIEENYNWKSSACYKRQEIPYIVESEMEHVIKNPENAFVVIARQHMNGMEQVSVFAALIRAGINKMYILSEYDETQMCATGNGLEKPFGWYFKLNAARLEQTYALLADHTSQEIMKEFIATYVQYKRYALQDSDTRNKYFFDGNTIYDRKDLYTHLDNEVWLNCGASIGDTLFLYFDAGLTAEKVYVFEGDPSSFTQLTQSLKFMPSKYQERITPIQEFISEGTPFAKWIDKKITLINADIQGNELNMLKALREIIVKDRPVLAICVYHKPEDLVYIPQYIHSIVSDYKYYLRKYSADTYSATAAWELVLYAVPVERCV